MQELRWLSKRAEADGGILHGSNGSTVGDRAIVDGWHRDDDGDAIGGTGRRCRMLSALWCVLCGAVRCCACHHARVAAKRRRVEFLLVLLLALVVVAVGGGERSEADRARGWRQGSRQQAAGSFRLEGASGACAKTPTPSSCSETQARVQQSQSQSQLQSQSQSQSQSLSLSRSLGTDGKGNGGGG
jgi:hypothetical protein